MVYELSVLVDVKEPLTEAQKGTLLSDIRDVLAKHDALDNGSETLEELE